MSAVEKDAGHLQPATPGHDLQKKHTWKNKLKLDANFQLVVKCGASGQRNKERIPDGRFMPITVTENIGENEEIIEEQQLPVHTVVIPSFL